MGRFDKIKDAFKASVASATGAMKNSSMSAKQIKDMQRWEKRVGGHTRAYLSWMGYGAATNLGVAATSKMMGNEDASLFGGAFHGAMLGGLARGGRDAFKYGKRWHAGVKRWNDVNARAGLAAKHFGWSGATRMPKAQWDRYNQKAYEAVKNLGPFPDTRRAR